MAIRYLDMMIYVVRVVIAFYSLKNLLIFFKVDLYPQVAMHFINPSLLRL